MIRERSSADEIQHKVDSLFVLEHIVESNHTGMAQAHQNLFLCGYLVLFVQLAFLRRCESGVLDYLDHELLVNDFHSIFLIISFSAN